MNRKMAFAILLLGTTPTLIDGASEREDRARRAAKKQISAAMNDNKSVAANSTKTNTEPTLLFSRNRTWRFACLIVSGHYGERGYFSLSN